MSKNPQHCIEEHSISLAWLSAMQEMLSTGVREIRPFMVRVTDLERGWPDERSSVSDAIDHALAQIGKPSCHTVANTIFPRSLWNPEAHRTCLRDRYLRLLPRLRRTCAANRNGMYFERLIAYVPDAKQQMKPVDQLEHVITTYQGGNHRRSALQVAIFNPATDHTHQRQRGFPCLQQIAFTPYGNGKLALTAFYATQYLLEKAYGNYLGLLRLGRFVAHELELELGEMNCMAAVAKLSGEKVTMEFLAEMVRSIEREINAEE